MQIAYDGKNYCGWQKQPAAPTVQETFELRLSQLFKSPVYVTGCGRTDSGVHARDFWLHFDLPAAEERKETFLKLNGMLPPDIRVLDVKEISENFNARFDATSREYRYFIHQQHSPFLFGRSHYMSRSLDIHRMNAACQILLNHRDFGAFCKSGGGNKTNLCTIHRARWYKRDQHWIFVVEADRFLRNMVRAMVGTLLMLGEGKIDEAQFLEILNSGDRRNAGMSAPPYALYLWKVNYDWEAIASKQIILPIVE